LARANKIHFYRVRHLWVISLGTQLPHVREVVTSCGLRDLLDWVNLLEPRVSEQTEAGNAKHRMEYINHITRPVRKASLIRVLSRSQGENSVLMDRSPYLAAQDEGAEFAAVNPVKSPDHGQTGSHPPAITHVLDLLRSPVQAAILQLSFTQPRPETILVDEIQAAGDGQRTDTSEDLAGMGLRSRPRSVSAVQIFALFHIRHCFGQINLVQKAQQRQGVQGTIQEAGVGLSPFISLERTRFPVL
jgi:hypothetical protein